MFRKFAKNHYPMGSLSYNRNILEVIMIFYERMEYSLSCIWSYFYSPCYVSEDSDIKLASRRVAWGKYVNAGQVGIHTSMELRR